MINADIFFVFYLIVWGFIGTSRGWVREVIVTFTMLFALFIYSLPQFTEIMNPLWSNNTPDWRFFWRAFPFLVLVFFGYLSPLVARNRFQASNAGRFEFGLLSFLFGAFNGYLLFSALAYWALQAGLLDGQYANLFTPPPGGWNEFFFIKSASPVIFSGSLLIVVLVLVFVFVIVVLV